MKKSRHSAGFFIFKASFSLSKQLQLLSRSLSLLGFQGRKNLYFAKLLVGDAQNADFAMFGQKGFHALDMHIGILAAGAMPHIRRKLKHGEAIAHNAFTKISRRLGNESCRFKEAVRFHEVRKNLFVAHIEPKSKICITLGPPFEDRMPSENWMIVDDVNKEAVIHPKNEHFYLRILTSQELEALQETERLNDEYTDLWKVFFDSISIKERENYRCQRNHSPLWARKHIVEFNIPHK